MAGPLHDAARKADRILDGGDAGHRAALQRRAVHDGGIEFVSALGGEDRAAAGVELVIILEQHHDRFDGVERAAAGIEHLDAERQRAGQRVGVLADALGRCGLVDHSRAAVEDDGPLGRVRIGGGGVARTRARLRAAQATRRSLPLGAWVGLLFTHLGSNGPPHTSSVAGFSRNSLTVARYAAAMAPSMIR